VTDSLYELSDGLFELRRAFLSNEGHDVQLTPEQVSCMSALLMHFGQTALKYAHEISRHRWNEKAHTDPPVLDLLDEAARPGTNVVLIDIGRPPAGAIKPCV